MTFERAGKGLAVRDRRSVRVLKKVGDAFEEGNSFWVRMPFYNTSGVWYTGLGLSIWGAVGVALFLGLFAQVTFGFAKLRSEWKLKRHVARSRLGTLGESKRLRTRF